MDKEIKSIIDLGYHKTGRGWDNQPYCIAFVFTPNGRFLVKGMSDEVENEIQKRFPVSVYHYTYWKEGKHRGGWKSPISGVNFTSTRVNNRIKHRISIRRDGQQVGELTVRRIPRRWLPLYNKAVATA